MPHITHIEIVKYYRIFEVRVIGPSGRPVQTFICPTIGQSAPVRGGAVRRERPLSDRRGTMKRLGEIGS